MSYRINFDESMPDLIGRLKKEHRQIQSRLAALETIGTVNEQAIRILDELSEPIVRHAVEEEAVVLRVIMHKAKAQSGESIKIAQEHNWIVDFIKKTIPKLAAMPKQQAKHEVEEFIQSLRTHFSEEESVMFPLALEADSTRT
jgi:hemerythrin-like domain-containing protein